MAELERRAYQIQGDARAEALRRFAERIRSWGLTMPPVEPQVLDLGLGEFYRTGLIEYWIVNDEAQGYCGKYLFVFDGQSCPVHHHGRKHETFLVLKGAVTMQIGGRALVKREGQVVRMPPGVDHGFTGLGDALLLEVSSPCRPDDNIFENRAIGRDGVL
jgi:quercetin dioxygenase-like cupin family protein